MSYLDQIEAAIKRTPGVQDYRIGLTERRGVSIGIRDNEVGNVYSPFTFAATTGGSFLIQWSDGRLSRGNLDGSSLEQIDQILAVARQAAYDDPDAANFLGPQEIAPVQLSSADTMALIDERPGDLLQAVALFQQHAQLLEAKTLSGGAGASTATRRLRTSQGLDLSEQSTSAGYSFYFDGIFGDSVSSRTPRDEQELTERIEQIGELFSALRRPAEGGRNGQLRVILHPHVAFSMLDFFLLGNLQGSAIHHGQSAFSAEDFDAHRVVLREDLSLHVDPLEPMSPGSYAFTGEGVPARPTTYVERGRLTSPILDLKYARKMGRRPTTPPSSHYSVHLSGAEPPTAWDVLRGELDEAVLVLSILGLHTQDRTSGSFSLSGPQSLYIRGGQIAGQVKAAFRGNFLAALRGEGLQLVHFPGQHSPGLSFVADVTMERGGKQEQP